MTGLDLSAESLALAKVRPSAVTRWVRQDKRVRFGVGAFDDVLNLFTSFGYFTDPADHLTVVGNIARSLSPGGSVVIDYMNVHRAEAHLVREEIVSREGINYYLFRWSDADAIFKRIVINERRALPHASSWSVYRSLPFTTFDSCLGYTACKSRNCSGTTVWGLSIMPRRRELIVASKT